MKPIIACLLLLLVGSCKYQPSSASAVAIGNKVKKCCNSLSIAKQTIQVGTVVTTEVATTNAPPTISVVERSAQLLTW